MDNIIPNYLLENLNEPQQEAVRFKEGQLLVLAGPGSGKTRVVTHRIAALLHQGVGTSQIAALTFTNKAANEMKTRLEILAPNRSVWIGTFHKFGAYLLRRYAPMSELQENFTIYDTDESLNLIKTIIAGNTLPSNITPQRIAGSISWAKNNMVLPTFYTASEESQLGKLVEEIYPSYQNELRRANAVDFDDLLLHVAVLLHSNPEIRKILDNRFRYILIDEYQDTNTVQYLIAKALSIDHPNLAVTGDPDQSIYGWRGANIMNILDFEKDFPNTKIIRLEQNYRSTPQILSVADTLIENNIYRKKKKLITKNQAGVQVKLVRCANQTEEAEFIAQKIAEEIQNGQRKPSDYAIFYRMNALSRNLEHALRSQKVPFQLVRGLEFFNRKEVKDILAYLRVVYNPLDIVSLTRIINEPARGIGKTTLKKLTDKATQSGLPVLEIARNINHFTGITAKIKQAITDFVKMIDRFTEISSKEYPVEMLIRIVLDETGYQEQYLHAQSEEDQERLENIEELLTVAHEFDTKTTPITENHDFLPSDSLSEFLEQAALVNDVDDLDKNTERVSLMTLHASKGLEFPVVYIIAVEEGILPHERTNNQLQEIEEERRLFFVGITRAQEELRLSRTERRDFRGSFSSVIYSRFLVEISHDINLIQYDSPKDFFESEDWGDGIRLVREKNQTETNNEQNDNEQNDPDNNWSIEYNDNHNEPEDNAIHDEYDDDGNPIRRLPPKKKKITKKISASLMTAAELQQQLLKNKTVENE
ncbi:MAG: UvrD-helicase domain-containing protein [Planctomycetaceae bacterium]|nr:UvrD-helicase domain-containing protein [Planctomycetaceae bacterium]